MEEEACCDCGQSINPSSNQTFNQPTNQSKRTRLKGITAEKSPFLPLSEDQPLNVSQLQCIAIAMYCSVITICSA